ncbi:5'-methylthioadenosine/S-adenosylhomocysteine nucleosidase [Cryobacterium sp. TMT2-18-3]|uniref:5'-methylthioadenosine/S-adenosylhomocysteine nucleosidase n=1 Tax=unclassified Cryobacterium TaxID=2649013 RepID=UPI00106A84F8|nr:MULTISPECIES: 5'-methylthioadenosine/S-adenosylhomocysteine nucleosidase [unclassified Cryobacterium]TFC32246.1 5'-methylthioadenosine/S-adenosylhomocysteine nucleosidase [Cryobacterium sp. TMT2-18-2]TFC36945.1 5'-methylthioadenosine/S-adenosylhomocysteine nucleosidase [Cryobacterium sp. TMT2-42-4]TFC62324.1 5'-methylthioadenosine/S-adenosylhomocysteine nucleosidase [Cryobacterium sp. TMT2-18-3]
MTTVDAIILVAMEEEAAPFLAVATASAPPVATGRARRHRLTLAGCEVLLVQGGIGLVNAAGATTSALLCARAEDPEASPLVISAGSAGGVGAQVRVGEVVIGSEYLNSDADARAFGYALGQVPGMPARYEGATAALRGAESAARMPDGSALVVRRGLLVSSDAFVSVERAESLRVLFPGVLATDMESVGAAQTCFAHGVPFVAVRGISDLCGPIVDHLTHIDDAADRSAAVVLEMLRRLAD